MYISVLNLSGTICGRFPTHCMYSTIVELKAENFLLPKEDKDGMRTLLRHVVANYTDSNFEEIISKVTKVAQEQNKEDFWFQCLKSLVEEDPRDKVCWEREWLYLKTEGFSFSAVSPFLKKEDQTGKVCGGRGWLYLKTEDFSFSAGSPFFKKEDPTGKVCGERGWLYLKIEDFSSSAVSNLLKNWDQTDKVCGGRGWKYLKTKLVSVA